MFLHLHSFSKDHIDMHEIYSEQLSIHNTLFRSRAFTINRVVQEKGRELELHRAAFSVRLEWASSSLVAGKLEHVLIKHTKMNGKLEHVLIKHMRTNVKLERVIGGNVKLDRVNLSHIGKITLSPAEMGLLSQLVNELRRHFFSLAYQTKSQIYISTISNMANPSL